MNSIYLILKSFVSPLMAFIAGKLEKNRKFHILKITSWGWFLLIFSLVLSTVVAFHDNGEQKKQSDKLDLLLDSFTKDGKISSAAVTNSGASIPKDSLNPLEAPTPQEACQ